MKKKKMPETSLEAYQRLTPEQVTAHHQKIIKAFVVLGSATADKIAEHTGIEHVQVNRRFHELRKLDLIYNTGMKSPTRKGRNAFVHTLKGKGVIVEKRKPEKQSGIAATDHAKEIIKLSESIKKNPPKYVQPKLL